MSQSLSNLADRMNALADNVGKIASDKAVACAVNLVTILAFDTPVDTSKALSNWQVGIGSPITAEIEAYDPGYLGYTAASSANTAIEMATQTLKDKKPGETIYVSNNANYIRSLNAGSSKQAPAGFVEASVMKAKSNLIKG